MVDVDNLLAKVSFDTQEIHGQIIRGLWMCVFTFSIGVGILALLSILLVRVVFTGGSSPDTFLSTFVFSYLLTILGGVLLFFPAILVIRYTLSKSQKERQYVHSLQDILSWGFFLSFGGVGSFVFAQYVTELNQPFGYNPDFTLANILIAVGAVAIYSSIGVALVLNFLLGLTTFLSFVSEYHDVLLNLWRRLWDYLSGSRPVLLVKNHFEFCKDGNHTLLGGAIYRLRNRIQNR